MGYWGWRPLVAFVFISVWIVGCTTTPDLTPDTDPTYLPKTPFATFSPPRTRSIVPHNLPLALTFTPQRGAASDMQIDHIMMTPQNDALLDLSPILCYETTTNRVICYGQIHNLTDTPLDQVMVEFDYEVVDRSQSDEIQTRSRQVVLYQRVLLPGELAPFHFWLDDELSLGQGRIRAATALIHPQNPFILKIEDQQTEHSVMFYRLMATISNEADVALDWVQAVMTVFDATDHVVGYRVINMGGFQQGESRPLEISIVPHDEAHYHALQVIGGMNVP